MYQRSHLNLPYYYFRQTYQMLGDIREVLGFDIPLMALTATASLRVKDEILRSLKMKESVLIFSNSSFRSNINLKVVPKNGNKISIALAPFLRDFYNAASISKNNAGCVIIYVGTQEEVDSAVSEINEVLKKASSHNRGAVDGDVSSMVKCLGYHAGMSLKDRQSTHISFINDSCEIVVATIAFCMGIDKANGNEAFVNAHIFV